MAPVTPPRSYWIVAGIALVWMLFGVAAWFMDFLGSEAMVAQMTDAQRELYARRPQWIFLLYAVAIFTGLAGAIGLLARKAWAVTAFAVSLVAAIIQFGYTLFVMGAIELLGVATAVPFPVVVLAIGTALWRFSLRAKARGWIA